METQVRADQDEDMEANQATGDSPLENNGASKTWSFKFPEHTDSDAEFERRMRVAFDACLRDQNLDAGA